MGGPWPWWRKVVAHLRASSEWSLTGLAEALGVDRKTLARWLHHADPERPRQGPLGELRWVRRIAELFGWPVGYLVAEDVAYPPPDFDAPGGRTVWDASPEVRRLVVAAADETTRRFLLGCLDHFEDLRGRVEAAARSEATRTS